MKLLLKISLLFLFYISLLGWAWGDSLAAKNKEGNRLYKEGRIDEALHRWRDAQIENPDNDKLHYNIANGLYEQEKYEDAFKGYEKTLGSKDSELQQKAYYNMGNTHYRMGKLLEAIEDYKKCLDINPNDEDAKYNIEFVRKKMEENLKKEEQKQSETEKSDGGNGLKPFPPEKEQKEGQVQEEKEAGEEEKKEEQAREEKEKAEKESAEEKASGEEKKEEMSKEDALRLLDALKDDEKDLQKELRNQPVEGEYKVDKDW